MKKIIIGVVVVLLIAGVIGGSFALANHFKKPDVTPEEKPIEKPVEQERVFQNAVLTNGAKVDKLYFNPDFKLVSTGGDGVFQIAPLSRETFGLMVDSTKESFTNGEITNYFNSHSELNNYHSVAESGIPGFFHFDNQSYGQNLVFGFTNAETNSRFFLDYSFDMVGPDQDSCFNIIYDNGVPYKFNFDELSITFDKPYMLLIRPDLYENLVSYNIVSTEPFYVMKDKSTDVKEPEIKDEVVETAPTSNLKEQVDVSKLYINPDKSKTFIENSVVSGSYNVGLFVKKAEMANVTSNEITNAFASYDALNEFCNKHCNGDVMLLSSMANQTLELSLRKAPYSWDTHYDDEIKSITFNKEGYSIKNLTDNKFFSYSDNTITFDDTYTLIFNPEFYNFIVDWNIISTVPYPAIA